MLLLAAAVALAGRIDFTGTIQTYTVPGSASYDIAVAGAQGGPFGHGQCGPGAVMEGTIYLTAGTQLQVVVCSTGLPGAYGGSGSGSGSFVYLSQQQLLIAAGGSGGGASNTNGYPGQITPADNRGRRRPGRPSGSESQGFSGGGGYSGGAAPSTFRPAIAT